jgi:hypothetical protein
MGAAISASETISSAPEVYSEEFPLHGLSLAHVEEFITAHGGRPAFEGMTSDDVCQKIIKPMTKRLQCSYVDLLRAIQHLAYQEGMKADVFVSHAWKCLFLDVVDTLLSHFADRLDTIVVWFDMMTINQHTFTKWWSCERTRAGIRDIGYTVMVLTPWRDPLPLTRAWCLFELFCTKKEGCRFEVAMGIREREDFLAAIHATDRPEDVVNDMLSKIDVAKSEADVQSDRDAIHKEVKEQVGFAQMNAMVLTLMRDWVIEVLRKEYDRRAVVTLASTIIMIVTLILAPILRC